MSPWVIFHVLFCGTNKFENLLFQLVIGNCVMIGYGILFQFTQAQVYVLMLTAFLYI